MTTDEIPSLDGLTLQGLFETVDVPTIILDADGSVVVWNEAEAELTGVTREEVVGLDSIGEYFYDGERDRILAEKVLDAPANADEVYGLDVADPEYALLQSEEYPIYEDTSTVTGGSGAEIWFIATPLVHDGQVVGVLEFVQRRADSERRRREMGHLLDELQGTLAAFDEGDFSARAEFEFAEDVLNEDERDLLEQVNDLARMREALRQQVLETTAAKRELERQNEKLERFASMVSHDLRNPLNVALGRIDLVAETGEEVHVEKVRNALERMDDMVDELLTFARSGGSIDQTEEMAVESLAVEAWEHVETGTGTLELDADGDRVEANPDGLLNVFENLFRNALEHNDGDVTVTVETESTGDGTDRIHVTDDGEGLPEGTDPAEIFEFGVTSQDGGTGFGLAIVRDIVDAHDWEISVAEPEAAGLRFTVDTD